MTAFYGEMESLNMSKLNLSSVRGNTSKETNTRVEPIEVKLDTTVSIVSSNMSCRMWYFAACIFFLLWIKYLINPLSSVRRRTAPINFIALDHFSWPYKDRRKSIVLILCAFNQNMLNLSSIFTGMVCIFMVYLTGVVHFIINLRFLTMTEILIGLFLLF